MWLYRFYRAVFVVFEVFERTWLSRVILESFCIFNRVVGKLIDWGVFEEGFRRVRVNRKGVMVGINCL